jgi:predicted ATP-dependent protease
VTLVKAQAASLGFSTEGLDKQDLHIHVPAGAIPKDRPSAGVAMFTSLASLLANRTVRSDTAMTGEISLRGLVLPVGGIKEKVIAAARSGIRTVILPARNRKDFDDIPESARQKLEFKWAERADDVLAAALDEPPTETETARRRAAAANREESPGEAWHCEQSADEQRGPLPASESDRRLLGNFVSVVAFLRRHRVWRGRCKWRES